MLYVRYIVVLAVAGVAYAMVTGRSAADILSFAITGAFLGAGMGVSAQWTERRKRRRSPA